MNKDLSAVVLLIEPAPYATRLIEELRSQWPGSLHHWYLGTSISQAWRASQDIGSDRFLPFSFMLATFKLWNEMKRIRPNIVFVAGWGHPVIVACIVIARLLGAKVVSMSDTWNSSSGSLRSLIKRQILKLIHRFTPAGQRQVLYLQRRGIQQFRIFPANMTSDTISIKHFIRTTGPYWRHRIRSELKAPDDCVVFLFVGRLESIKGPDLLLDAFTATRAQLNSRLIVVGDGSMRQSVIEATRTDGRLVYRGRLEGEELWAQFAAADILVVPSRAEPWGLVVNEALSAGIGVVVHDCCGCIDDLIEEGRTGMIVPTGDHEYMQQTLSKLSQSNALVNSFREACLAKINGWTTEAWAANILKAWWDLVDPPHHHRRKPQ